MTIERQPVQLISNYPPLSSNNRNQRHRTTITNSNDELTIPGETLNVISLLSDSCFDTVILSTFAVFSTRTLCIVDLRAARADSAFALTRYTLPDCYSSLRRLTSFIGILFSQQLLLSMFVHTHTRVRLFLSSS